MASIKKYATKNGHMWRVQYRSPTVRGSRILVTLCVLLGQIVTQLVEM